MAISSPSSLFDDLFYCQEHDHQWHHVDYDYGGQVFTQATLKDSSILHLPPLDLQDLFWEDEELASLLTKEQEHRPAAPCTLSFDQTDPSLLLARKEAVDWILKVKAHYGFKPLTAILSINYLDRFLASLHFQKDKPWMIQLVAVTCLSLAAKVEETQVPLLLDLQVEDSKYLFEAKNIQKMELLVMSTLKWRMNPVTPISFLDHFGRRLGFKKRLHCNFFTNCEALILSLVSDSRFIGYQASVLATATMLQVIDEVDPSNSFDFQSQLLDILKTTNKEKVKACCDLVAELSEACCHDPKKRKHHDDDYDDDEWMVNTSNIHHHPCSPVGVMDASFFSCNENSNDSWDTLPSSSSALNHQYMLKKMRIDQQQVGFA